MSTTKKTSLAGARPLVALLVAFLVLEVSCQQQQQQLQPQQQQAVAPLVSVNPSSAAAQPGGVQPKRNVDVHVPIFFDMTGTKDNDTNKLDLSVLQGLVTVQQDKSRTENGNMEGPIKVAIAGWPVYSNQQARQANEQASQLLNRTQQINEQVLGSLNNFLGQLTNSLRPLSFGALGQTGLNNGRPQGQTAANTIAS